MAEALTVRQVVFRSLIKYPMLFKTKGDVFEHLFLSIGNGYEWENGGLVEVCDALKDDEPCWADENYDGSKDSDFIREVMQRHHVLDARRQNNRIQFVLDNFDAIFDEPVRLENCHHAESDYCRLYHMPEDVRDDWKIACDQTSHALGMWLNRLPSPSHVEAMREKQRSFRFQHFAEKDRRMREMIETVLEKHP